MKGITIVAIIGLVGSAAASLVAIVIFKSFSGVLPWEKPQEPQQVIKSDHLYRYIQRT